MHKCESKSNRDNPTLARAPGGDWLVQVIYMNTYIYVYIQTYINIHIHTYIYICRVHPNPNPRVKSTLARAPLGEWLV